MSTRQRTLQRSVKRPMQKSVRRNTANPFTKKDWYDVKAPAQFSIRHICKTPVNRTIGTRIASDSLKGRVFESSLADLNPSQDSFRKFKFIVEEVQGKQCLTNFNGMELTTDKLKSMIKKKQTLIESHTDVKTIDGYQLRVFCIGFTKKRDESHKQTAYAKHQQIRSIRKKMCEIINKEIKNYELKEVVNKLIPDSIGDEIKKQCSRIYPLGDVYIKKVKVIRKPKFDLGRLLNIHGETSDGDGDGQISTSYIEVGQLIDRPDNYEPPIQSTV